MTVLYTSTTLQNFTYYSESFDYGLAVSLATNPTLADNENFMGSRNTLRVLIDSSNTSITEMNDIYASQRNLTSAKWLIDNLNLFN
jgi:hypothetical protein